jgi:NAD+ synthase
MMDKLNDSQLEYCRKTVESEICSFVKASGAKGAIVAVSGGIDSAVVLSLAAAVVDVHALIMPEMDVTDKLDVKDAEMLAKALKVPYSVVEIKGSVDSVVEAFPWVCFSGGSNKRLALANIKPRLRMIFNYVAANLDRRVVLGTSNRTEMLLGYFTKFGDGGCDFEPIGALYKSHVRQLARYLEVPERIIAKKPSAGLWPGQTDEGELGATYEVIDDIIHLLADEKRSVADAAKELGASVDLVAKMHAMMLKSRHKLSAPQIVELKL